MEKMTGGATVIAGEAPETDDEEEQSSGGLQENRSLKEHCSQNRLFYVVCSKMLQYRSSRCVVFRINESSSYKFIHKTVPFIFFDSFTIHFSNNAAFPL